MEHKVDAQNTEEAFDDGVLLLLVEVSIKNALDTTRKNKWNIDIGEEWSLLKLGAALTHHGE